MSKPKTKPSAKKPPGTPVSGTKGAVVIRKSIVSGLTGSTSTIAKAVERKNAVIERADTPEAVAKAKASIVVQQQTKSKIDIEIIREFTPDFAAELLKNTPQFQRTLRKALVDKYASDMLAGRWRISGDPVRLTPDLKLIDGQHRCAACVRAGVVLKDVVLEVLYDEQAFESLDQAAPRHLRDIMKMGGGASPPSPTVMAGIIFEHLNFQPRVLSMPEKLSIINSFGELDTIKKFASTNVTTAGMLAAVIRCLKVNRAEAVKFFDAVFNNRPTIDGEFNDNAHLLATWVYTVKNSKRTGKSAEGWKRETAYRCLSVWNAWRKGVTLKRLVYDPDKPMPTAI